MTGAENKRLPGQGSQAAASAVYELGLLRRWREGSEEAGAELFERHFASVHRFFSNKCSARMDDLIQETFVRCLEGNFRGDSKFRTYLFGVATNVLYEEIRQRAKLDRHSDVGLSSVLDTALSPSGFAAQRQQWDLLASALTRIPVEQQLAIEMHYLEGLTGPEIAEALGVSEGTVRSRLRRGLERVRAEVNDLAPSEDEAEVALHPLTTSS